MPVISINSLTTSLFWSPTLAWLCLLLLFLQEKITWLTLEKKYDIFIWVGRNMPHKAREIREGRNIPLYSSLPFISPSFPYTHISLKTSTILLFFTPPHWVSLPSHFPLFDPSPPLCISDNACMWTLKYLTCAYCNMCSKVYKRLSALSPSSLLSD